MSDSRKYQVVLPPPVATQLDELAAAAGERPSTLAAHLIRNGIAQAANDGKVRPLRPTPLTTGAASDGERAVWLEPWGGDTRWRADMWGQILALHGRYPQALAPLKEEWWTDEQHVETLCALATWRTQIDESGVDPREELAFQAQLNDLTQPLRQEGGGVAKAWKPGAPPDEWTHD
jgi:hypothetical protein